MTNIHILRQLFDVRSISRQSNPLLDFSTYFQPIGYGMSRDENRLKKVKTSALKRGLSQWPGGEWKKTAPRRVCLHTEGHRAPQWTRSCTLNGSYLRSAHFCNEQKGTEQTHRTRTVQSVHLVHMYQT